jgi:NHL repeat
MTSTHHTSHLPMATILAAIAALLMLATASIAHANTPPVKLIPTITVDNGFQYPESVAVNNDPTSPTYGNIYVADRGNHRIQELTATGVFVSMFGGQVNQTRTKAIDAKGGTPTQAEIEEENICTAASKDICQAGARGEAPGQFGETVHIAIDPSTGDIYTVEEDTGGNGSDKLVLGGRVQEFTAEGHFVLEAGQEVNLHTKGSTCTHEEMEKDGVQCTGPALHSPGFLGAGVAEPGALARPASVAVGGPEDLVYVGEEHRAQEFEADGKYKREIPLTAISPGEGSQVTALAVNETGDVYLDYRSGSANIEGENTLREFDPAGQQIAGFPLSARSPNALFLVIEALSVSSSGRLAVSEVENVQTGPQASDFELRSFGSLLEGGTGRLITEFSEPGGIAAGVASSAFGPGGEMYAAKLQEGDVLIYRPVPVAELTTGATVCSPGVEDGSDVTFACTLAGEANPEGVAGTEAFFELGRTSALGEVTAKQPVASIGPVSAGVQGLVPDETYYDRLAGEDENSKAPESSLRGETVSFATPSVAPKVPGAPSVSFLTSFSAVFSGELNPENTNTAYEFQYGVCENLDACSGVLSTRTLESAAYGQTTAILEARDLKPATVYHYRLLASNQHLVAGNPEGGVATGTVGIFITGPAPVLQAAGGPASAVGTTSATIAGSVNPDGQPAVYTFEAGLYEGAATQYGVVLSAAVGAATTALPESVGLSGLQPGATYAYRIKIASGYGTAYGETLTFTTRGLPSVLSTPVAPPLLGIPAIAFPNPAAAKHATPKHATRKKRSRTRKRHAKRKGGR